MIRLSKKFLWQGIGVLAVVGIAFYLAYLSQGNEVVQNAISQYGYAGIFVVAFVSGFNLVVPLPAIAFMPLFLEAGLNFWITITIITVGITCADSIAYIIGGVGHKMLLEQKKYTHEKSLFQKLLRIKKKHRYAPLVVLFVYSIIAPLPNELMVIPMGLLGYRYMQIFPIVLVGNFIFNIIYATGVESLFQLLI